MTRVSIVVVGWREADGLNSHLSNLNSVILPSETEIIAVVGGGDGTLDAYRDWASTQDSFDEIEVLEQQPDDGISGAVHRGFREASGEYIFYLEVDTTVREDWLVEMVGALENHDAVSADFKPKEGNSLRWIIQWFEDREALASEQPRLSGAQTIGLSRQVVEDLFINDPLPDSLVDWHMHKRVAESSYSIGRADTTVETRIASSILSYGDFCRMQANAVSEIDNKRSVFKQFVLHVALLALPPVVATREWSTISAAAQADTTAWCLAPLYLVARQVFIVARVRMCLGRLLYGPQY